MRLRSLGNGDELLGEGGEDLGLDLAHDDEVLDPDPAQALEVDPRFDGHDLALGERVARLAAEARRLVHLEAEAVAEPVAEVLAEAGLLDHLAGAQVGVDSAGAWADRVERGQLRSEAHVVGLLQAIGKRARRERARAVRVVGADPGARVDYDGLAGLDLSVRGPAVRSRSVRAACDDRLEARPVAAELVEELVEPPGEVPLGAARELVVREALERLARDLRGAAYDRDFVLVLHCPERLDEPVARHELDPARVERRMLAVRHDLGLEPDLARELLREERVEVARRLDELGALDRPRRLGVAEVAEEEDAVGLDEDSRVRTGEAGQVDDVGWRRDEQRLLERLAQAFDALVHVPCSAR